MVLIGMPGLQKRLARYAQPYSRVGFVHQFQPLSRQELQGVIEHQWVQLGLDMADDQHVATAVINAIARVTGGNFRLVERLFAQIERIVTINNLPAVTTEVVTLARETGRGGELESPPNLRQYSAKTTTKFAQGYNSSTPIGRTAS
jgi:DNA transposition AAA+ family ATPase